MDPKLKLKPIELIDIGIDNHTKIPVPILTSNVVATFNESNNFQIKIININENINNIILVDGLTIEMVKLRYNWFLNANVKNCVIGEDSYGLVWYLGEWLCGEWIKGTWYSGIWHDGVWRDGKFYSYLIDKAMIISSRFVILDKDNIYSEFRSGTWMTGDFYNGTFGYDDNLKINASYTDLINRTFTTAYWESGRFHDGIFKKSVWIDGIFYNGKMESSYWLNGKFYNGSFYFHNPRGPFNWYDGNWYGGDFIEGSWKTGTFNQIDSQIKSRFGTATDEKAETLWWNGKFLNGEFHSGLNLDANGNTLPSISDGLTHWKNGSFSNGKWYGGYFQSGIFYNGEWFSGIFNTATGETYRNNCIWENGTWYTGLWINGVWKKGHFYSGMWLDGLFLDGYLSTNSQENIIEPQKLFNDVNLPKVIATSITNISYNSAVFLGEVIEDGGGYILDRGVCWTTNSEIEPEKINDGSNYYYSDQGTMGNMTVQINNLIPDTEYFVRAYAENVTGISYSNLTGFTTSESVEGSPNVETIEASDIIFNGVKLFGIIHSSVSGISEAGFYYSTSNTEPDENDTIVVITPTPSINTIFMAIINGDLLETTRYYVRAYAVSDVGTGYGNTKVFDTPANTGVVSPTVAFKEYSQNPLIYFDDITSDSAKMQGNVISNGGAFITERGVCYTKYEDPDPPTIFTYKEMSPISTTGIFPMSITGLPYNRKYKVRVYAINSLGLVGYSNTETFTTQMIDSLPSVSMIDAYDDTL